MRPSSPLSRWVFTAVMVSLALGVRGVEPAKGGAVCDACLEVCERPLSFEDSLLDDGTDSYLLPAVRLVGKTAAVEMAAKLRGIHRTYQGGYFGKAYEVHGGTIEGLLAKPAEEHVSSAEIRSLKAVRAALYADTITLLDAAASGSTSAAFVALYGTQKSVLQSVIRSMASRQQMRSAERMAVCEVLFAYKAQ